MADNEENTYTITLYDLTATEINYMRNALNDLDKPRISIKFLEGVLDSISKEGLDEIRETRKRMGFLDLDKG